MVRRRTDDAGRDGNPGAGAYRLRGGRAIFLRRGDPVLEAHLPQDKLGALLARADSDLAGLKSNYVAMVVTDLGDTVFALATEAGRRQVSVYAFFETPPTVGQEQDRPVMDRLRSLRSAFLDAVSADAKPFVPDEVTVVTYIADPVATAAQWPPDLPPLPLPPGDRPYELGKAVLHGEEARKAAAQVTYRSWPAYRVGDRYLRVEVAPTIPANR